MVLRCDACGGRMINRGEETCSKCGLVRGPELEVGPAFFGSDEGVFFSNHPPDPSTGELGSVVGKGNLRGKYNEVQNDTLNKIRWGEKIDRQRRGKKSGFIWVAKNIQSILGLPNYIKDDVLYYHRQAEGAMPLVGYSYEDTAAGFTLFVCRLRKYPIAPKTIYCLPYTHGKTVKKICYSLARHFHKPLPTTPLDYLNAPPTTIPLVLIGEAKEHLKRWRGNSELSRTISGDSPAAWAATAVTMAGGEHIDITTVAKAFKISPNTIKEKMKRIRG